MKKFLFVFYVGLYAFVAGALVTVDVVSIKAGWPWLSTLVKPMGIVFLAVNIPLAFFAVLKIGHVVYLHSAEHHAKTMQRIRAINASPSPTFAIQQENLVKDETLFHKDGTGETLIPDVSSFHTVSTGTQPKTPVGDQCNVAVAYYLADHPLATIRQVERNIHYPIATISRTNAWKNRSR